MRLAGTTPQPVQFVVGDMNRDPDLGLKASDLQQLRDQVTVVINAAADVSLHKQLPEAVQTNCVSYLTLMTVLAGFSRLRSFLHVSTTYVNSFLPADRIEERIYRLGEGDHDGYDYDDPERELSAILSTGSSAYTHRFSSPYALAKYLAERLMLDRATNAPAVSMLIVRPSLIGPAIRDPYPGYGAEGTIPMHTCVQTLLGSPEYGPFRLAKELPQHQVLDEIPVDLVANTCLAHLVLGTTGIVHTAVQLYVARTVEETIDRCHRYTPPAVMEKIRQASLARGQDLAPDFFRIVQQALGDWTQDCSRSQH
ncbi:hypothetical protein CNMCM8980_005574 [Aspergillus fumigatiaffinis]|nr:hypothetical protein CNMCM8980_005574 [Aspergillus fumigatiaffinis]